MAPFTVTTFSFTWGSVTITPANGQGQFEAGVVSDGSLLTWSIVLTDNQGNRIETDFAGSHAEATDVLLTNGQVTGIVNAAPGTWTMADPVPTPEPATWVLLLLGASFLALMLGAPPPVTLTVKGYF